MKRLLSAAVIILAAMSTAKVVASNQAGLHIEFSDLKDTFHRTLTKYTGECPGENWSGMAQKGDIRFIDRGVEPNRSLKVTLINLSTGDKITRDYKKAKQGSNDFNLTQLGNSDGEHNIEYQIYDKSTKETVGTGTFIYTVTSSEEVKQRDAKWKLELYCPTDPNEKLKDCDAIASRKIKYCGGVRTGDIGSQKIFDLDRKTVEIDL